jgi:branched-chain amino acid transport system ATP-binding protein
MLEIKNINVFYGDAQALWDVTFTVFEKSFTVVIGANGAGKSTILRTISNLIKPRSGEIYIDKKPTIGLPPHNIVKIGIAHIPEGRQLFPFMTVLENLKIGAILPGPKENRNKTLQEVFELFPVLEERRNQLAQTLSGGEQQMLAIARGLMLRPRLILLDEPSLGLAPLIVSRIFEIIKEINQSGITVLLVEQNVQRSLELADEGIVLENGHVVLKGKGVDLLNNEHVKRAYLGI